MCTEATLDGLVEHLSRIEAVLGGRAGRSPGGDLLESASPIAAAVVFQLCETGTLLA